MNQTQNQSKYYYSPRFRHFNIYRRDPDGDTPILFTCVFTQTGTVIGLMYSLI